LKSFIFCEESKFEANRGGEGLDTDFCAKTMSQEDQSEPSSVGLKRVLKKSAATLNDELSG
jgi:hypothetical protein